MKIALSIGVVLSILLLRWFVGRVLRRQLAELDDDIHTWFKARRIASYIATIIAAITLTWIWVDAFDSLPTYLGLVSAGLAVALSDVLRNMAGWLYILIRRPLRVGQRVDIRGVSGDVIDVRLFRFTLMEIGNWVHADQSTGRLVHVPNGVVFTDVLANYTEGSEYIWHEVPVLVTFESNWQSAKAIILNEIEKVSSGSSEPAAASLRSMAREYRIKVGKLTPIVYLTVKESGVLLTARYLVAARARRGSEEKVWEGLLKRFGACPDISLAYPTVRTYLEGPIELTRDET